MQHHLQFEGKTIIQAYLQCLVDVRLGSRHCEWALQGVLSDPHHVVDSLPITQCGWRRRRRCALMRGQFGQGYVATKKQYFFGLRLYFTTNVLGLVDRWLLAPASLDEHDVMPHLVTDDHPRAFMADRGYISADLESDLMMDCGHRLLALRRRSQKQQWHPDLRHVVKTMNILEHPNAKSGNGPLARVDAKLFAYNFAFVLVAVLASAFNYST